MGCPPLAIHDAWIRTPGGRLAVRAWIPDPGGPDPGGPDPGRPDFGHSAPPVLLFHDSLGCIDLWRSFPAALATATGRPVIAYDRLGFGRSDPRQAPLALDFIEDEARNCFPHLAGQLGLGPYVAYGHSVGGAMAAHCAARSGPACRALVTESAQLFVEDRTRDGVREAKARFEQPELFERLRRYHGERSRWVLEAWTGTWLDPAFAGWTLEPVLAQVRCPTLVLHGSADAYGSLRHPEGIARAVAGRAERVILPGAGHVPHRDREAEVVRRVAGFLASLGA